MMYNDMYILSNLTYSKVLLDNIYINYQYNEP